MLTIQALTDLDETAVQLLQVGYESPARYRVQKEESPDRTVLTLELEALPQPYVKTWGPTPEELQDLSRVVGAGMSFGAYAGEQLVGIAIAEARPWNRSLWIWELMVGKAHQRLGAGNLLVKALAEKAFTAGLRVLVAETQNTNVPAIRFYRAAGFEIDGIDLSYYTNTDADDYEVAIFMKKKL